MILNPFFPRNISRKWILSPWILFLVLLTINSLFSFVALGPAEKSFLILFGLLAPMGMAMRFPGGSWIKTINPNDKLFPAIPVWSVFLVLMAALFIRFYNLTLLSGWPLMDEGLTAFFAMEQSEKWRWDLFGGATQVPSAFYWLLGLFFKITGPSLESLWLFPALLSLLTIPVAYVASIFFAQRSSAWMATTFFGLSFWPFYLGRFCVPHVLLVCWEIIALIALGFFRNSNSKSQLNLRATLLGLTAGFGFYIHLHWIMVALMISVAVGWIVFSRKERPWRTLIFFLFPLLLLAAPLGLTAFIQKTGNYLSMLWILKKGVSWNAQWQACWDYFSSLFWGVQTPRFTYKPFWGGFLNPLLDAVLGLGLVGLYQQRRSPQALWIGTALFLFILPGWLTQELEMFRLVLLIPMLLFLASEGLGILLGDLPIRSRGLVLTVLVTFSASMDFYHLLGPYQAACHSDYATLSGYTKSFENWKAYQILKKRSMDQGPGLILTEMESSSFNQTLTVTVYPYNAARNPHLSSASARWMAFLTNINYAPFLSKRFPRIEWFELSPDRPLPQVTLVLGIIVLDDPESLALANHWLVMERAFRPLTSSLLHLGFGQNQGPLLKGLSKMKLLVKGDRFLESCLDEKIFFVAMSSNKNSEALSALGDALEEGYPAAHIFNDLGVLWFTQGDYAKARQAFESALHSPLNHTNALENLRKTPGS